MHQGKQLATLALGKWRICVGVQHGGVVLRKVRPLHDLSLVSTRGLASWPIIKAVAWSLGVSLASNLSEIKHSRRPHLTPGGIAHVLSGDIRGVALFPPAVVCPKTPTLHGRGIPGAGLVFSYSKFEFFAALPSGYFASPLLGGLTG